MGEAHTLTFVGKGALLFHVSEVCPSRPARPQLHNTKNRVRSCLREVFEWFLG
jgi:hypothetical protein